MNSMFVLWISLNVTDNYFSEILNHDSISIGPIDTPVYRNAFTNKWNMTLKAYRCEIH